MKNEGARAKIVTKYHSNTLTGLPAKYKKPKGKKHIEFIIVEGDSAMGTALEARDPETQGILPIRGKFINVFANSREKVFANEEFQSISKIILGTEYKRNFKIEDVKVEKIILMADADVDGNHICALLLRMFLLYFPQLIQAGMVYKAIPPLYSTREGKKNRYFIEQIDIVRYIQKKFLENYTISVGKNNLSSKEVTIFLMRNADYIYWVERLSNTYSVDPYLFEMVINNYFMNKGKINLEKLNKEIKARFRFMQAKKSKGSIIVEGTIKEVNSLVVNERLIKQCEKLLEIIAINDKLYYNINGEKKSIYEIMKLYEAVSPSNISRYKGLGEMNKKELKESTIFPGLDRTLVRYTLDDIKEEIEAVREYESNPKKILELVGNISRDDLLE
jgi:DNA gyrase subunit B